MIRWRGKGRLGTIIDTDFTPVGQAGLGWASAAGGFHRRRQQHNTTAADLSLHPPKQGKTPTTSQLDLINTPVHIKQLKGTYQMSVEAGPVSFLPFDGILWLFPGPQLLASLELGRTCQVVQ